MVHNTPKRNVAASLSGRRARFGCHECNGESGRAASFAGPHLRISEGSDAASGQFTDVSYTMCHIADIDNDCHEVGYDLRMMGRSSVSRSRIPYARMTPRKTIADENCCVEKNESAMDDGELRCGTGRNKGGAVK